VRDAFGGPASAGPDAISPTPLLARSGSPALSAPLARAAAALLLIAAPPASAKQVIPLGDGQTLAITGFVNASIFTNRCRFGGFGQGQNSAWAAQNEIKTDEYFTDGDVRNSRLGFEFTAPPAFGAWAPRATIESDYFGGQDLPPFGDKQPRFRVRLVYADLATARTTLRIGQYWAPFFGEIPVSVTHIAFPLGYGSAGMVGWRFPGVFVYHDLNPGKPVTAQLQLAALQGSGPPASGPDSAAVNGIGNGAASGLPQLEARLNLARKTDRLSWTGYFVGHVDWKDTTGTGVEGDNLTSWGFEAGGNFAPGRFTLHGNWYYGKALGQQFAHVTQQGNVRGWGAWGQAGYDFDTHWGVWLSYGVDDPDQSRFARENPKRAPLARLKNQTVDGLLRFRAGRYALGLEWFRSSTDWNTGRTDADQVALSMLFTL
jgi:hypothetical protein